MTYAEAAAVTDIGTKFATYKGSDLSFFQYFTGVTSLVGNSFNGAKVEEIKLPDSITTVESWAFNGLPNLESVNFGSGLRYWTGSNRCPFRLCPNVTSVIIPSMNMTSCHNSSPTEGDPPTNVTIYVPANAPDTYEPIFANFINKGWTLSRTL